MKILIIGDLHIKLYNMNRTQAALIQLHNIAQEVDMTVFLGDQYDSKSIIRSEIQNMFIDSVKNWPNKCYILCGNHDMENLSKNSRHSMEPLRLLDNTYVINKYMIVDNLIFFSFMDNEEFLARMIGSENGNRDILFMHQGIDGFMYSNGIREQSSIKIEHLKQFKRVFSGHIHKPQQRDNIIYVGTPYTTNFGESNEDKRVIIYDTETDRCEDIKLSIPQHKQYTFQIDNMERIKEINKVLENDPHNIIQIIAKVPVELANKVTKKVFKIPNLDVLKKEVIQPKKEVQIKESLSPEEMMNQYIDIINTQFDKEELKELNKEILNNV